MIFFAFVLGLSCILAASYMLYAKYRVVLKGKKCIGKIVGIEDINLGISVRGARAIKHAYIVKIGSKKYYTAHGCLFKSMGKKKIGEEMVVFRKEKYGRVVYKHLDLRIEIASVFMILCSVLFFLIAFHR